MTELTLSDLVANGTMSAAIAATLATAAGERRSMLVVAIPRLAGKTTTLRAALAWAPAGTAVHQLSEEHGAGLGIPVEGDGGYLLMSEIADVPFADYLWDEQVRQVFHALSRDFSLATALHAPSMEAAFDVICGDNRVPDEDAARIDLVVYIRTLGADWRNPTGRRVATVHEIEGVSAGKPQGRLLHRWDEAGDRFEPVEAPRRIGSVAGDLERRVAEFTAPRS